MSDVRNLLSAIAGTLGLDRGGETSVNSLSDIVVPIQKASADAMAADTTNRTVYRNKTGEKLVLVSAEYIPDAALTAHDTNYATLLVNHGTAGALVAATVALETKITGGTGNWVADTPEPITLHATQANRELEDGEIVNFDIAKASSGVAVPAGVLVLKYRRA